MLKKINQVITDKVNPVLDLHKGSCKAIDYKEGTVYLEMFGGCNNCPGARLTLLNGVLPVLKENLPEVDDVLLV